MPLGVHSGIIDQVVGISNHSWDSAQDVVVDLVELAWLSSWDEELAGLFFLSTEDNTVFSKDADYWTILIDMFNGILNLQQTSIWIKCGSSTIVLVRLQINFREFG